MGVQAFLWLTSLLHLSGGLMGADLTTGAGSSAGKNDLLFSHTIVGERAHMHGAHSPTRATECMTNINPNPSGDFIHDALMLVVVEFIWEWLPSAGPVTHPASV